MWDANAAGVRTTIEFAKVSLVKAPGPGQILRLELPRLGGDKPLESIHITGPFPAVTTRYLMRWRDDCRY